jgi:hypothetical protein
MDYPITHVNKWFCCLNAAERAATIICAANAGSITYFVLKTLFDASFLLAFEGSASIRREIYVENWGLTEGSFPPDAPDAIEVYFLDVSIWNEINAYFDEHGTSCADECKILTFSS